MRQPPGKRLPGQLIKRNINTVELLNPRDMPRLKPNKRPLVTDITGAVNWPAFSPKYLSEQQQRPIEVLGDTKTG